MNIDKPEPITITLTADYKYRLQTRLWRSGAKETPIIYLYNHTTTATQIIPAKRLAQLSMSSIFPSSLDF